MVKMSLPLHPLREVLDLLDATWDAIAFYKTWYYSSGHPSETSQGTVC